MVVLLLLLLPLMVKVVVVVMVVVMLLKRLLLGEQPISVWLRTILNQTTPHSQQSHVVHLPLAVGGQEGLSLISHRGSCNLYNSHNRVRYVVVYWIYCTVLLLVHMFATNILLHSSFVSIHTFKDIFLSTCSIA